MPPSQSIASPLEAPRAAAAASTAHSAAAPTSRKVAYVMNGFPRLSETFIAHEIHQLERLGMSFRLFSVKRENEPLVHPVIAAIRSPLSYLPKATPLTGAGMWPWLRENLPAFREAHGRLLRRHPLRWLAAAGSALALALRHRRPDASGRQRLRKVFIKEFLQAGAIADAVLRAGDVGHLHGHFCHGVATIAWFASRMSGIPFSFTAHAKDIYQAELNPGRLLERKMGAARFVATCTCANAQVLRARHPRPCDVHAVYHGLDTDSFAPEGEPGTAEHGGVPTILSVGRFVEKKGFDHLVRACARLRDDGLEFRCLIVGEPGGALESIRALIDALGLAEQVQLRGAVTQDELRRIYARASVFALPCQVTDDGDRDGFPNVLAEAMAMGVAVVSTRISGIPEFIDHAVHGLLIEPRDSDALAQALRRVLDDRELRARLARAGRERICERFDSRQTTLALRDLFARQLAAEPRMRPNDAVAVEGRI
jgi:glycosyltransferase involved in cell wall biosynthesis